MSPSSQGNPSQAAIVVDVNRTGPPVSRRLFGKFTEHLGANVYLGAWAQIVPNPEFAPADRWPEQGALDIRLERNGAQVGMPDLVQHAKKGFAPFWTPEGEVTGEVLGEDGRDFQSMTIGEGGGGLRTGIFLPLHRVRTYELVVECRGRTVDGLTVDLTDHAGNVLSSVHLPLTDDWGPRAARLTVADDVPFEPGDAHALSLRLSTGTTDVKRVLLTPSDHVDGWDPEVVDWVRRARLPLLRFPGGNFASGYHWTDGVGPPDERPVLTNPAWPSVVEFNHVGTDEWLRLCELTGAEPMICINAGDGTPQEARRWIEYCNAPADSKMGARRADNGRDEPWNVRLWEIGNELYGRWQIGHVDAAGYARRYMEFLKEMSKTGEGLHFIANGFDPAWNRAVVDACGDAVKSLSAHFLIGYDMPADADPIETFEGLMGYTAGFEETLRAHVTPMVDAGLPPRLAITELQIMIRHDGLPRNSTQTEALYTASVTNASIRSAATVEMITHSALVNHGGGLRKERGVVYANPVWWVTHLYSDQSCLVPAAVRVESPSYETNGGQFCEARTVPALDAAALLDGSGKTCNVFVVNRSRTETVRADVRLEGFQPVSAEAVTLEGGFLAANTWQEPDRVKPRTSKLDVQGNGLEHAFEPCSVTRMTLMSS